MGYTRAAMSVITSEFLKQSKSTFEKLDFLKERYYDNEHYPTACCFYGAILINSNCSFLEFAYTTQKLLDDIAIELGIIYDFGLADLNNGYYTTKEDMLIVFDQLILAYEGAGL